MYSKLVFVFLLALSLSGSELSSFAQSPKNTKQQDQSVTIQTAYPIRLPGGRLPEAQIDDAVDCNSPVHWDEKGNMYVFTSVRQPFRSTGTNLYNLSKPSAKTTINHRSGIDGGKWLEATYRDSDGVLFGWYHNEPPPPCSNDEHLSAPRIGAMFSRDEGMTWQDLGLVLEAPADSLNCQTKNFYFAGGNGDFSVMLDLEKKYFYFFFGTYHAQIEEQGVSIARMNYADRFAPIGNVWKWRNGNWNEPGLGGRVTPIFNVVKDWHSAAPDAFWGPSIHFNTSLNQYAIVMNRAVNTFWQQEGIYISFSADLADPQSWTNPDRLPVETNGWAYPQFIGIEKGETDKLAGRYARLFLLGISHWVVEFRQLGNEDPTEGDPLPPAPARPARLKGDTTPDRQPVRSARPSMLTDLDLSRRLKSQAPPADGAPSRQLKKSRSVPKR
jgi:hypothetical protein